MMDPSYEQLNEYTHYLEGQLEKFSAFMLTQKKLNEKHVLIENVVDEIMQKIEKVEDKLRVIEINEKDNLYELRKIRAEKEALKSMELRIENIEQEISSLFKSSENQSLDQSSEYESEKIIDKKSQREDKRQPIKQFENKKNFTELSEENLEEIYKYLASVYIEKEEALQIILKAKDEIEFKVKKLQIEVEKNKESFLKLTSQINTLTKGNHFESPFQNELKAEKRLHTESTKDLNFEPLNQENAITKKELKKMEKKLENFFKEKLTEINSKSQNKESEINLDEKSLKFKKIQEKYDRLTSETTHHHPIRSERKIDIDDKRSASQKKISLFDNEILREKHGLENRPEERKNKQKRKSKNEIETPFKLLESPRYGKGMNNSKSQNKLITKRKSPDRLKRVNQDYMISQ